MSLYQRLKQLSDSSTHLPTESEIIAEIKKPDIEGVCYICGGIIKARKLCSKHHTFAIRNNINTLDRLEIKQFIVKMHKDFEFLRTASCLVCNKVAKTRGLCNKHYNYIILHRYDVDITNPIKVKEFILKNHADFKPKGCYICDKIIRAHGLCHAHLAYAYNHKLDLKNKDAVKDYILNNHYSYRSKLKE